jgi:hypothetical protein
MTCRSKCCPLYPSVRSIFGKYSAEEEVQVTSKGKAWIDTSCAAFPQQYAETSCEFHVETRVSPPMADIVTISCCGLATRSTETGICDRDDTKAHAGRCACCSLHYSTRNGLLVSGKR